MCVFVALSANQLSAQVYEKGNFVVDAFYGGPNLFSSILRTAVTNGGYENGKVKSLGPLGITAEYLVAQKIGVGIEATYSSTEASYDYYDSYDEQRYHYEFSSTRLRILPRVNFHFSNSTKVDPYLTCGIGYANFKYKYTSNDPNDGDNTLSFSNPGGVATRVGFGVRYFFTDHFGAMAEAGVGGPLVRFGLSAKF